MNSPLDIPSFDFGGGLGEDVLTINKSLYESLKTSTEMLPKKVAAAEEEEGTYQLAKVLKDYAPKDQSELQLEESDIIRIYPAKTAGERFYGSVNGVKGFFPSQNVKVLQETDETAVVDDDEEEEVHTRESSSKHEKKSSSSWFTTSSKKTASDVSSPKIEKIEVKHRKMSSTNVRPEISAATTPIAAVKDAKVRNAAPGQRVLWVDFMGGAEKVAALNLSKQEIKRQEVIYEIICTEADYIHDLEIILELYIRPLQKNKIVRPKDMSIIFSNLEQLIPVNQELLRELEHRQKDSPVMKSVGDILIRMGDYLKMYTMFCSNHPYAMMKLQTLQQTRSIQKFLDTAKAHPDSRSMDLGSYLLKPIQRVCKYPLLVRDLLRATDAAHPDNETLNKALLKIETVVSAINEGARHTENVHKMLELQAKFVTKVSLVAPSRFLIKNGQLAVQDAQKPREVMLFNDLMVIAKPDGNEKFKLLNMIAFEVIVVKGGQEDDKAKQFEIEINHVGQGIITLLFDNPTTRDTWLKLIQSTVADYVLQKNRINQANGLIVNKFSTANLETDDDESDKASPSTGLLDPEVLNKNLAKSPHTKSPTGIDSKLSNVGDHQRSATGINVAGKAPPTVSPSPIKNEVKAAPPPIPTSKAISSSNLSPQKVPPPAIPTRSPSVHKVASDTSSKSDLPEVFSDPELGVKGQVSKGLQQFSHDNLPSLEKKTGSKENVSRSEKTKSQEFKDKIVSDTTAKTLDGKDKLIGVDKSLVPTGAVVFAKTSITPPATTSTSTSANIATPPASSASPPPAIPVIQEGSTSSTLEELKRPIMPKITAINRPMKSAQLVEMIKSGKPSHPVYQYVLLITYQVGDSRKILRKFDDFFELHLNLLGHFPEAAGGRSTSLRNLSDPNAKPADRILPELPAQMMFVSETVAAQRMMQLQDYISTILSLPPKISKSPPV